MIYRVEFRKDGAVASCIEVESQFKSGGLVCFVEAESRADAITKARSGFERWAAKNKGKCRHCGGTPSAGKSRCEPCRLKRNEQHRKLYLAHNSDSETLAAHLADAKSKRRAAALAAAERGRALYSKQADERWERGEIDARALQVLRRVRVKYDQNPDGFRSWLARVLGEDSAQLAQAAE